MGKFWVSHAGDSSSSDLKEVKAEFGPEQEPISPKSDRACSSESQADQLSAFGFARSIWDYLVFPIDEANN